jgi:hypothetical protein
MSIEHGIIYMSARDSPSFLKDCIESRAQATIVTTNPAYCMGNNFSPRIKNAPIGMNIFPIENNEPTTEVSSQSRAL